jgi:hypothetical protein
LSACDDDVRSMGASLSGFVDAVAASPSSQLSLLS